MVCLCFPSFQHHTTSPWQDGKRSSRGNSDHPRLVHSCLVPSAAAPTDSSTTATTQEQEHSTVTTQGDTTSTTQKTSTAGSSIIRKAVEAQGVYGQACKIICASWRDTTQRQYSTYLKRWEIFCIERQENPFCTSVDVVIQFLTHLFESGLGYSAINTARSALAAVVQTNDNRSIGTHPMVVRFMKGVFELRTPQPKYQQTWDVEKLLSFFRTQEENKDLNLKELTKKLCALLMITTAQRVQTIHLIRKDCITCNEKGCTIVMKDKLKHTRPGHFQSPFQIPRYTEEKLCVVACLEEYMKRTGSLRSKDTYKLLLCYTKPHGPASKDTVSRWLRDVLHEAGIEGFAPHSFRGASSSAMLESGVSLECILKTAGWSNAATFHRYYNKPLAMDNEKSNKDNKVQQSILNFTVH